MPTTERNVSSKLPSRLTGPRALPQVSAPAPLAPLAPRRVQRVLGRHRATVLPALLTHTSSTEAALALMQTAFAPVLT